MNSLERKIRPKGVEGKSKSIKERTVGKNRIRCGIWPRIWPRTELLFQRVKWMKYDDDE